MEDKSIFEKENKIFLNAKDFLVTIDKPKIIMDTHMPKVIADGLINEILTADISDLNNLEIEAKRDEYTYYIKTTKTERGLEVKLENIKKEVYQNRSKK